MTIMDEHDRGHEQNICRAKHQSAGEQTRTVADEVSLLELSIVVARHKRLVFGLPLLGGIVATIVSLLITPLYTGTTKMLPPQQQQSTAAAVLGQLGGLIGGASGAFGIKNPADLYVGMLKSRTVLDSLIQGFELTKVYDVEFVSDARKRLEALSRITAGKDGIVTIEVEDTDPKRAAAIANGYVEALTKLTDVLAVTEASQRRLFFERQLQQARDDLRKAELAAGGALEFGGLAAVDARGKAIIETSALMRARIAAKEVEVTAMHGFAGQHNPDLGRAREELSALRRQLTKLEGGGAAVAGSRSRSDSGMRSVGFLRDVKYHEFLFELLAKQYELARIDEAKEGGIVQVIDRAIEADRRTSPKRTLIIVFTIIATCFLSFLIAFVKEAFARSLDDPTRAERLALLRSELRLRSPDDRKSATRA